MPWAGQTAPATPRLNSRALACIWGAEFPFAAPDPDHMATKTTPLQFIQQVRTEVSKVVWPSRREVMLTTIMVFIMAALTATFFSLVDLAIRTGLRLILG